MSIKSLGKIAAVAAVAGLALTACADEDATQARNQEESCGLIQSASLKATESMNSIQATEGSDDRAAFVFESVALDLRNHSFDRSNDEPADRKSTRLNSSHVAISYAVFCLKKKKT